MGAQPPFRECLALDQRVPIGSLSGLARKVGGNRFHTTLVTGTALMLRREPSEGLHQCG